ncbi:MAG: hypothetical protein JWM80_1406 [Cyanobacteria bacterium RYN_339]|nr:hypothetical protein [Cyanobacteria bacterium RYN_339]
MAFRLPSYHPPTVENTPWLLGPWRDGIFYLCSPFAGWAIILAALAAAKAFPDSLGHRLQIGPLTFTVWVAIWTVWHFLLDVPHGWGTYARTLLDPEEWQRRQPYLALSFGWFLVGPVALACTQWAMGAGLLPAGARYAVFANYMLAVQLWTYHHVARQHWGMVALYRRKAYERDEPSRKVDWWAVHGLLYLPVVWFVSGPVFPAAGYAAGPLRWPVIAGWSIADVLHPASVAAFVGVLLAYGAYQWRLGMERRNTLKLLLLAGVVPLHVAAFCHPLLATLWAPILVVGHNLQYMCLVYHFGRARYRDRVEPQMRWARLAFAGAPVFLLVSWAYVYATKLGPWVTWLSYYSRRALIALIQAPTFVTREAAWQCAGQMIVLFTFGFVLQHYYLDGIIWRLRDEGALPPA